jgi:hypothetical protein
LAIRRGLNIAADNCVRKGRVGGTGTYVQYKQIVAERTIIFPPNLAKSGDCTNRAPSFFWNGVSDENVDLGFVDQLF